MKSQRKQVAFSLIEILIVLAIVSILAGIVYAATGGVREKSRQSRCISNLRQIGYAFRMYCQDNDMVDDPRKIAETKNISVVLRSYSKNEGIWKCNNAINSPSNVIDYNCNIYPYPRPAPFIPLFEDAYSTCNSTTPLYTDINHTPSQDKVDIKTQSFWLVLRYEGNVNVVKNKSVVSQDDLCLK